MSRFDDACGEAAARLKELAGAMERHPERTSFTDPDILAMILAMERGARLLEIVVARSRSRFAAAVNE